MGEVHRWIICDSNSIVVDDGMYRSEGGGWTNQPRPLPPPSECIRVDIEVATQGADPNFRLVAIRAYELDNKYEKSNRVAKLTGRQKELLKQYIDDKVPPYMLKMGGEAVVQAFLGDVQLVPSPRPRKQHRPQNPNEQAIRFACYVCGREAATATVGGVTLKPTIGYRCIDCGKALCNSCQKARVKESAEKAGLAGTIIEHLGKPYPYEEWYGEECQYCRTDYAMEWVFGTIADSRQATEAAVPEAPDKTAAAKPWWQFWR